jgi:putative transposase
MLLSAPAVLLRRNSTKDAELLVLRHENAVLRRQVPGSIRYEPADRFWFAALSGLIPRRRCHDVFPGHPGHAAYLATLATHIHRRQVGLHPTPRTYRSPLHPCSDQETRPTLGHGQSPLGT